MILPLDSDGPASDPRVLSAGLANAVDERRLDIVQSFIDASTGARSCEYSDRQTQSAVGRARGVLGDSKKISASGERKPFHGARPASAASDRHL